MYLAVPSSSAREVSTGVLGMPQVLRPVPWALNGPTRQRSLPQLIFFLPPPVCVPARPPGASQQLPVLAAHLPSKNEAIAIRDTRRQENHPPRPPSQIPADLHTRHPFEENKSIREQRCVSFSFSSCPPRHCGGVSCRKPGPFSSSMASRRRAWLGVGLSAQCLAVFVLPSETSQTDLHAIVGIKHLFRPHRNSFCVGGS